MAGLSPEEADSRWDFRENWETLGHYSVPEGASLLRQDNEHAFSLGVKFTTWAKSVVGRYVAYVYMGFLGLEKQMSNPEVKGDLILYPRLKGQFVL